MPEPLLLIALLVLGVALYLTAPPVRSRALYVARLALLGAISVLTAVLVVFVTAPLFN